MLGPRTRLLALNWASKLTGSTNDVAGLTALARSAGAMTYVDAVQLAPHQSIDVQALGASGPAGQSRVTTPRPAGPVVFDACVKRCDAAGGVASGVSTATSQSGAAAVERPC